MFFKVQGTMDYFGNTNLMDTFLRFKMNLLEIGFWVLDWFTSLNAGIEFSPLIACWIFILAAVNWIFPSVLPSYFNWTQLSTYFRLFRRCVTIWMMYYFIWVPANRALFWTLKEYLHLPVMLCQQWLPFLSLILSIYTLALSMSHSGLLRFVKLKKTLGKLAWAPATPSSPGRRSRSSSPSRSSGKRARSTSPRHNSQLRTTRNGTIYGVWNL